MADHPPKPNAKPTRSRIRSLLGKYRIEGCLAEGYRSNVYRAYDTIEGTRPPLPPVRRPGIQTS